MRIKDMYPPITTEVNKLTQLQVWQDFGRHKESLTELAEKYEIDLNTVKRIIINN